jgi:hypothetical protein
MTLSRDTGPDSEAEAYDVPRGTCPGCGSRQVRHHLIGEPVDPSAMDRTPRWVVWEGCLHPGYTRSCRACRLTWMPDDDE